MQRICLKLQGFFQHLTPNQGAPSSPPGRNTSRLALPKSEWQLQIRIWAHHLKYKLRLEAKAIRKKNLTRQLAAKGAVSINALARKVAVDEALIGYTSSDPASKYIVIMAWYKSFKRIQGHIPYHWPTQSPKHFHSQQSDLPFHQLQPIHDLSSIASGRSSQIAPSG